MGTLNKVILMGNLTHDPQMRYTPNGTTVCKISIAMNKGYKDKDGERQTDTTFVDIDFFGNDAKMVGTHFKKSSPILIEGRLEMDQWTSKTTGEHRCKLGVIADKFQFVG